uniref:sigma-E factor regulatory protein RseB n=1 Tax=Thaumasiovibrio occultus TaxID=1891184 RepID=UPI000B362C70|nr:sigma-E factor regulatory protein RseB [Thaumasiovibrio occultus]
MSWADNVPQPASAPEQVSSQQNTAPQPPTVDDLLQAMDEASRTLNYEISYIVIRQNSIETVRFRHALDNDTRTLAHLVHLSGPPREVIQRGDEVSYFEPGVEPFTIATNRMVSSLPPIMSADIYELAHSYDFIPMGRDREAGVPCSVVRIAPKDGRRYSYLIWVDEKSKLIMRADLLDRDGELLEQFRVVSHVVNPLIIDLMRGLDEVTLPQALIIPQKPSTDMGWQVTWLPHGFESIAGNRHRLLNSDRPVESQLYSDGLFSFSIYVADADNYTIREQMVRQGRRTLHSHEVQGREISVVGDIPPSTAKLIAESISFEPVAQGSQ